MNHCKDCDHYKHDPIGGQSKGKCLDPSKIIVASDGSKINKAPDVSPYHRCTNWRQSGNG